jgi:hypothetical protein
MKPQQMLKVRFEKRRGMVTQETGSAGYLLIDAAPDAVLDRLIADKLIGAARRDCITDVRKQRVLRPVGVWGMLIRLKGHQWTYLIGDGLRFEWPKQWAERHGWRVAWFSIDGTINTKVARLFHGSREVFNFVSGIGNPEAGFLGREDVSDETAQIRGTDKSVCSKAWLDRLKSGGQALDLLAKAADAYLPVALFKREDEGKVRFGGWDGKPYDADEDEVEIFSDDVFERVDVFTFGKPETLEPTKAQLVLGKAVRSGDAKAAARAIADGADPNVMPDDVGSPLWHAINLGSPYLQGGRFKAVTPTQQLKLIKSLLAGGATPDPDSGEPSIHQAIHWANEGQGGDVGDLIKQFDVLLEGGADPNAMGTDLRSAGQRPLHVLTRFGQHLAAIKFLVSRGADVGLTNRRGDTPRQLAEKGIAELEGLIAKNAPKVTGELPGAASIAKIFAEAMLDERNETNVENVFAELTSYAAHGSIVESRSELERLQQIAAFLAKAEKGKTDVSDIAALSKSDAAVRRRTKAKAKREEAVAGRTLEAAQAELMNRLGKLTIAGKRSKRSR